MLDNPKNGGSVTITEGVRVAVSPSFLPEHSDLEEGRYVFAYRVRLTNESEHRVQLLSRHWLIIDGDGERSEVDGEGVVGQQPVIEPGQSYSYSSFCPLQTEWGTMEGWYTFRDLTGREFRVEIGRFFLAMPQDAVTNG
jgi:ApaG protein